MNSENQIQKILKAHIEGTITQAEKRVLEEWIAAAPQHRTLLDLLEESTDQLALLGHIYKYDQQRVWSNIRREVRRRRWRERLHAAPRYAAAAVVALVVGGTSWWMYDRHAERQAAEAYIEQLMPGERGAVLTLSSGEQISLETAGEQTLVEQDGSQIAIDGRELAYAKEPAEDAAPILNTVFVPRGKEFSLELSDGTRVWLNSESSLVFPVRFGKAVREVTVTGEAYFEVAHDASRRFVVHADTVAVSVYGTAFNLSAYADDAAIETTLVRGSVEVKSGRRQVMLEPGQQASVARDGSHLDLKQVPAEEYAAWVHGEFAFNDETVASICRKLSRWYNVEIVPRGIDPQQVRYTGVVKRYETFAEMARMLERTNQIRAEVQDRKIILYISRNSG